VHQAFDLTTNLPEEYSHSFDHMIMERAKHEVEGNIYYV